MVGIGLERCVGIIVRRRLWSETSLIVTWLTDRFGTTQTIVKGALRPKSLFSGKLDLFQKAEVVFKFSRTSSLHSLREAVVQEARLAGFCRGGYLGLAMASYFAELATALCPAMQPCYETFDLLDRALKYLETAEPTMGVLERYEKRIAKLAGAWDEGLRVGPQESLVSLFGSLPETRRVLVEGLAIGRSE